MIPFPPFFVHCALGTACDVREWIVVTFRAEIIWSLDNFFQTINRSKDNGFNGNYELS